MAHGFDDYRVFLSAPGDLDPDRAAVHDILARVNEAVAMPANILLVTVGLRENGQIDGNRAIVSDNVRWSSYFIQLFQDDWGPRDLFRKLFLLALECRDNPEMPMRDVVVCVKNAPHESNPEILAFRKELLEMQGVRAFAYDTVEELRAHLERVSTEWAQSLIAASAGAGAAS
ncbi:MAG TPA: hypothetical protein VKB38_23215 [Terracidiphilus sp.]|nr:hypothetical protein [Terracidiphilus sp.]